MLRRKIFSKVSLIFLAMMIIFSMLPFPTSYVVMADDQSYKEVNISENLKEAFKETENATYIVKMKEQLDVEQARIQGELAFESNKENHANKEDVIRSHIVHSLQNTSNDTQVRITRFLDKKKENASVQSYHSFYIINALEITSNEEVMREIAQRDDVLSIALNETHTLGSDELGTPTTDKDNKEGTETPWNLNNINAPEAWELGFEGDGVTVGIIDSGVDHEHPALKNQWRGIDSDESDIKYHWLDTTTENTKLPTDRNGHGTHVTGSVLGQEPDGTNQIGVAPKANWIAAKVFNEQGETTDASLLKAGEWMLAPGGRTDLAPDIINNSWSASVAGENEYYRDVLKVWRSANILPVFAAGNVRPPINNGGPGSVPAPANYPEAFTVGALNEENMLTSFSLLGPSPYEKTKPEVSAPGEAIRSSVPGGQYASMDGTSMASPHVAGLAALILEANPSLSIDEVEDVIMNTANPLTDSQFPNTPNNGYGFGVVNALNAVSVYTEGLGELVGEVTIEGEDDKAPEIFHTPLNIAFNVLDQEIYAQVKDNVGIKSVHLETRLTDSEDWKTGDMKINTGTTVDGMYEGKISVNELTVPGIEYRIKAIDYSGNETTTEVYELEVSEGVTKGYMQDFETDISGFEFQGDDIWEWGVPTTGPEKAHSGEKVMATKLDGNYEEGSEGMLILPLIDLREENDSIVLSFAHWYKLGNWMMASFDTAEVYVGTKSETEEEFEFELVKLFDYSQREWKSEHVDLTPYLGEQIIVIFNLRGIHGSDLGWYIDDIELTDPEAFIPDAPEVSVRSNTPGRIIIEWPYLENDQIKDYVIYRSQHPTEGFEEISSTTGRNYGEIPEEQKGTYYYYVRSRTYANELSEPSNTVSWTFTGGEEIYSNDFEGDSSDWTVTEGGDWEVGVPKGNPDTAVSGENVWGTNLNGDYTADQEHMLTSPTIDLTEYEHASVYFQQWYDIDYTIGEYGYVEISKDDGETWDQLEKYPRDQYDSNHPSRYWYLDEINIDEYVGEKVNVRFRLDSKNQFVFDQGWYIDDFEVRDTPAVKSWITSDQNKEEEVDPSENAKTEETQLSGDVPSWDEVIQTRQYNQTLDESKVDQKLAPSTLPIGADISILETNRSTKSDAGTGEYSLKHPDGEFTARVSAYGYETIEEKVEIKKNEVSMKDFNLEPLATVQVSGKLTDAFTGKPIADGHLKVIEDAKVTPVQTDKEGNYTLELYEGNYHLVASALGYMTTEISIEAEGNNDMTVDVKLTPYESGDDVALFYDDGTAENAVASNGTDAGYAVRMTTEGQAQLLNARFYFWDEGWPTPGGEDFQYAIYDADGVDGKPGTLLAGPYDGTAKLDGSWTEVPIIDPLIVDGDYYVVYIQKGVYPNVPALGIDMDGDFADRSWRKEGKRWAKEQETEQSSRNYMIRSTVRPILGEKEIEVTELRVEPNPLVMKEEEEIVIDVTGIVQDGEDEFIVPLDKEELTYKSLDEKIATVDADGKVTAKAPGETEFEIVYKDLVEHVSVQVDKSDPGEPDPEEPEKPDPGDPDPEDPEKPDPGEPDPEDPEKPDPGQSEELLYPEDTDDPKKDKVDKTIEEVEANETGEGLPKTATNIFNIALVGLGLFVAGLVVFFIRRKRTTE